MAVALVLVLSLMTALPAQAVLDPPEPITITVEPRAEMPDEVPAMAGGWLHGAFHVGHGGTFLNNLHHMVYDPIDDAWDMLPPSPLGRDGTVAAELDGYLYFAGGFETHLTPDCVETLRDDVCPLVDRYDPVKRAWQRLPDMPTPRANPGVAAYDGRLYVAGGTGSDAAASAFESLDPSTGTWMQHAPLPKPLYDARTFTAVGDVLVLVGGQDIYNEGAGFPFTGSSRTFVYRPALDTWSEAAELPVEIWWASLGTCDGRVFVFDGFERAPNAGLLHSEVIRAYDPSDLFGEWTEVGDYFGFFDVAMGGSLTKGNLTMAAQTYRHDALVCPTGTGPWETEADLVVTEIVATPEAPDPGDTVRLDITVHNRGVMPAAATQMEFKNKGFRFGDRVDVPAIGPGEQVTVQGSDWTAIPGNQKIEAWIDLHDDVPEWNEDNNVGVGIVPVTASDLVVAGIALSPPDAAVFDTARLAITIRNQGEWPARASHTLAASSKVSIFDLIPTPAIGVGEEVTIETSSFRVPSGSFGWFIDADWIGQVDESDETNNEHHGSITGARPDLIVRNITIDPVVPYAGDIVTFSVVVANDGLRDSPGSTVRFSLDGEPFQDISIPGLAAGQESLVTSAVWNATLGDHTLDIEADILDEVTESDETNNGDGAAFEVLPIADLVVDAIVTRPTHIEPGEEVKTSAVVRNDGSATSTVTTVSFFIDGEDLGVASLPALAPGETVTVTAPDTWKRTPGSYTLRVVADDSDAVDESDEANNTAEMVVKVAAGG